MADYEIPVISDGQHVVDMLNAVKLMTGGSSFSGIIGAIVTLSLVLVMMGMIMRGNMSSLFQWFMAYAIIWGVLFVPKVNVIVVDRSDPSIATNPVANVPIGIAMTAWITTAFGDRVATTMETIMSPVDAVSYQGGNMLWGTKIMSEMPNMQITDARVADNVNNYLRNCVFPIIASEPNKMQEIKTRNDLWSYFASNAPASRLTVYTNSAGTISNPDCQTASGDITADLEVEKASAAKYYGQRYYSHVDPLDAATVFTDDLSSLHQEFIGVSRDGAEMLRQVMVLNQFESGLTGYASDGASATLMNYVNARSQTQWRATAAGLGGMMQTGIPKLYSMMFVLLIAIFPFIIAVGLVPGMGWSVVKNYFNGFVYLQAFPVLFIIINRFIVVENAQRSASSALATTSTGQTGITLDNMGILAQIPSETSAMAALFLTLIPALAGILFTKGVSALGGHLESVLRPMHVASESAGSEASTGNINVGNSNTNTHGFNTTHGNSYVTSPNVDTNRSMWRLKNGSMAGVMANGEYFVDSRDAVSSMMATPEARTALASEIRTSQTEAIQSEQRTAQELSESQESLRAQTMGFVFAQSNGVDLNSGIGVSSNREFQRGIDRAISDGERIAKSNGVDFQDLMRAYASVEGHLGYSNPGFMKGATGIDVGVTSRLGGEGSLQAQHMESILKSQEWQDYISQNEGLRYAEEAMQNQSTDRRFSRNNEFTDGYNRSLQDVESKRQSHTDSLARVEALDKAASYIESNDQAVSFALGQIQFENLVEKHGHANAVEIGSATSMDAYSIGEQVEAGREAARELMDTIVGGDILPDDFGTAPSVSGEVFDNTVIGEEYGRDRAQMLGRTNYDPGLEDLPTNLQNRQNMQRGATTRVLNRGIDTSGRQTEYGGESGVVQMYTDGNMTDSLKSQKEAQTGESNIVDTTTRSRETADLLSGNKEGLRGGGYQNDNLPSGNNGTRINADDMLVNPLNSGF